MDDILSFDNLYKSALKCCKGVKWKKPVAHFMLNLMEEITKLYNELHNGTYKERQHKIFTIYEPKEREVLSICFRDRVYQRTLNDLIVYPKMTKPFIDGNCACQKGKGLDYARNKLKRYLIHYYQKYKTNIGYLIHIDIKKYYPSMSHKVAEELFKKYLPEDAYKLVLEILKVYDGDIGYNAGSQLVQILGVSLLNGLDHYIKEVLKVKCYVRYMDDLILIVKENPEYYIQEIGTMLVKLELKLNTEKTKYIPLYRGDTFLGFKFSLGRTGKVYLSINKQNVKRRRKKMLKRVKFQPLNDFVASYQTWRSHAVKGTTKTIIQRMDIFFKNLVRLNYGFKFI